MKELVERLLRYISIDTQSQHGSQTIPSTEKQKDLGRLLVKELLEMGVENAEMDEFGAVYASIPSNSGEGIPAIGFTAHMDTAPDLPGCNICLLYTSEKYPSASGGKFYLPWNCAHGRKWFC